MAVLHLLWWWLVVQVLWLIALPICLQVLRPLPDRGTSVAKAFGIIAFVYPLWFFGSLGFLDNSRVSYALVLVAIGALSVAIWRRSVADLRPFLWSHRRLLIVQEGVFLAAYLGFGLIRMFNPEVVNTEKFMDFAFMSGAWRSESFPPARPVVCRRHDQLLLLRTPHGSNPHAPLGSAAGGDVQPDPRAAVRPRRARRVRRGLQPGAGTPLPDTERADARRATGWAP